MAEAEVHLHLDHVLMRVKDATEKGMAAIAHQVVAHAVVRVTENDQVDTGFMRAAIYPVSKEVSGFAAAEGQAKSRANREVIDEGLPSEDDAMVVAGANYSIYQEMRRSFLFAGAVDTAADTGMVAEVERVFREENHD